MTEITSIADESILLIEDDVSLGNRVALGLKREGYRVQIARDGQTGLDKIGQEAFDLVLLDWMLPDIDGLEVLKQLRAAKRMLPVLMLTARGETADRVQGLDSGADDYLPKPFALSELLARMRSLLRRTVRTQKKVVYVGALEVDLVTRKAAVDGAGLELTPREFDVLAYLMTLEGDIASRHMLIEQVWKVQSRFTSMDNVIDVHMTNLRKKLRESIHQSVLAA